MGNKMDFLSLIAWKNDLQIGGVYPTTAKSNLASRLCGWKNDSGDILRQFPHGILRIYSEE